MLFIAFVQPSRLRGQHLQYLRCAWRCGFDGTYGIQVGEPTTRTRLTQYGTFRIFRLSRELRQCALFRRHFQGVTRFFRNKFSAGIDDLVQQTFVALLESHAEFHKTAGAVAQQINAGQYEQAERLIGSGSRFALVSTEVATCLAQAKRGL